MHYFYEIIKKYIPEYSFVNSFDPGSAKAVRPGSGVTVGAPGRHAERGAVQKSKIARALVSRTAGRTSAGSASTRARQPAMSPMSCG